MSTTTFTLRAPADDDVPALVALDQIRNQIGGDWWATTAEDVVQEWHLPGFDRERMAFVAETDEGIVGMFTLYPLDAGQMRSRGFVHPDARGRGIGTALLRSGIEAARGAGAERLFTHSEEQVSFTLFEAHGFRYARTFVQMINGDPAGVGPVEWPEGTQLVPLRGRALVDAFVFAMDNSFVDHWNFTPTKPEIAEHWLEDPTEDPALWFIAKSGDAVAGCCICHLQTRDGVVRGHLGPIGTTRAFRGIGLGRAMLRHGVREMAARSAAVVTLGVDMENPNGALGLYERNGFTRVGELRVFELPL